MTRRVVTVFGGSGFVGRHVVQRLAKTGVRIRVAVRDVEAAMFLKPLGHVGQINLVRADVLDQDSVTKAVDGADWVINLVGLMHSSGRHSFRSVHAQAAGRIAAAASAAGASRFVHVSALGADLQSPSAYLMTKAEGEQAVKTGYGAATILRPSVIFGREDQFFNRFAALMRFSPVLPVFTQTFTGEQTGPKFQPVFVGDVADAVMAALTKDDVRGKTFELGGPRVMTMREVMEFIIATTGRKRWIMPVHTDFARFGAVFTQFLPNPPLTPDQITMLEHDNTVTTGALGFKQLGIANPETVEAVVPAYLSRYRLHHNILCLREG